MKRITLTAFYAAIFLVGISVASSRAHSPTSWYGGLGWVRDLSVTYAWTGQLPTSAWRTPIKNAAATWNKAGAKLTFVESSTAISHGYTACGSAYQDNGVWYRSLSSTYLAWTSWCTFSGTNEMYSFQLSVNKNYSWYIGTGTPSSSQYDLQSVATHELGHAGGWAHHWNDPGYGGDYYCSWNGDSTSPTRHTMCAETANGTIMQRTLGPHDLDTFQNRYGLR
jgi:hypothetical protein